MCCFMKKIAFLAFLICCTAGLCSAQLPKGLTVSGYADAYLAFYTDSLPAGSFQKFPTYAPRSNSIGLNIAQLSAVYKTDDIRATVTLHYGDIPASSWSGTFNMVQEANAGIRLHKKLWIDAGFFRTHIGAEGLYPKENITSSIAVVTLFEPYYQAGIKLTCQITKKLEGRLYLLNGYNLFEDNNRKKSLGMLFTYAFNEASSLVYANYLGDDTPDSLHAHHTRFYNNLVYYYDKKKLRLTAGADFAVQQHADRPGTGTGKAYGGLLSARYTVYKHTNLYVRGEGFYDTNGFLAGYYKDAAGGDQALKTMGGTLGIEYKPLDNAYIRLEGRTLKTYNDVKPFYWNEAYRDQRYDAVFSLGVWF